MSWIKAVLEQVVPSFGGIPTFCEDLDGLLEHPDLREALRQSGLTLMDWDGDLQVLEKLKSLSEDEKPLVVVRNVPLRHRVESELHDYRWCIVSVGDIFKRLPLEFVRTIPMHYWDLLYAIHQNIRGQTTPMDAALLVARAIYGLDHIHVAHGDGWLRMLIDVALSLEGLPAPVAAAIHSLLPSSQALLISVNDLTDPTRARALLDALAPDRVQLGVGFSRSTGLLLNLVRREAQTRSSVRSVQAGFIETIAPEASTLDFVQYGLRYARAAVEERITANDRVRMNRAVGEWVQRYYPLAMQTLNPAIFKVQTMVKALDSEVGEDSLLFIVVDGMGLQAWNVIEATWKADGVIGGTNTRVGFALLPTVTSISRRAIFEGKLPVGFGAEKHSQRLERLLWVQRFREEGAYFSYKEPTGILDAFALGKQRVCVVDVTWDDRCHSLNPDFDTLVDSARVWARRTSLRPIIAEAFRHGYRVIISSDHGEVECEGKRRHHAGELVDERSKRVLIFTTKTLRDQYQTEDTIAFQPPGLPSNCWPLFARDFTAFDNPGTLSISHGGISLDEILVPVVEVYTP